MKKSVGKKGQESRQNRQSRMAQLGVVLTLGVSGAAYATIPAECERFDARARVAQDRLKQFDRFEIIPRKEKETRLLKELERRRVEPQRLASEIDALNRQIDGLNTEKTVQIPKQIRDLETKRDIEIPNALASIDAQIAQIKEDKDYAKKKFKREIVEKLEKGKANLIAQQRDINEVQIPKLRTRQSQIDGEVLNRQGLIASRRSQIEAIKVEKPSVDELSIELRSIQDELADTNRLRQERIAEVADVTEVVTLCVNFRDLRVAYPSVLNTVRQLRTNGCESFLPQPYDPAEARGQNDARSAMCQ